MVQKVKIILVNLILFFILFHVVDFCCTLMPLYAWYYKDYNGIKLVKYVKDYKLIHTYRIKFNSRLAEFYILSDKYANPSEKLPLWQWEKYRPKENKNAKNSILLFGCSFAYGASLSNQDTFSYKLGQSLPNYAIYNRAKRGWSTSHMLYQLENKDFKGVKNLKYVVYVFIDEHISRNLNYYFSVSIAPYYKNTKYDNVKLQEYSTKYIDCPVFVQRRSILMKNGLLQGKNAIELTKNIILSSKGILDYEYKAPKFIVLRYDKGKSEPYDYMFEELKKRGIIVLTLKDLSNNDYITLPYQISKTDVHPNAKAWKEIAPLFVKYMQARGYFKD